jgi:sulfonate transport system substrate-binding protein
MKTVKNILLISILSFSLLLWITGCSPKKDSESNDSQKSKEIRIGIQKLGPLVYLKNKKILEDYFSKENIRISWIEFTSGPPMLEALNTESIDFCTTGDTPPIFAQSAGINLYYIANEPASPEIESIVVPENSKIKSLQELKGKKVGVTKGSSAHYSLIKALALANLKYDDITPVFLQPADARAAFEKGSIDAWVIWEPYLSAAKVQLKAKIIAPNLKPNTWYYLAAKKFTDENPELITALINNIIKADEEITKNTNEFAKMISQLTGLPEEITLLAVTHQKYGAEYITQKIIDEQQEEANAFYSINLIPKPVKVSDIVWKKNK